MRMQVFTEAGVPHRLIDTLVPELRTGELLIAVSRCTLCRSDLHTHAGRRREETPTILGHEIVGRIRAFGTGTASVDAEGNLTQIGDRVTWAVAVGCGRCFFCAHDLPQKCESSYKYGHRMLDEERPLGGGLAEFVILVPGTYWLRVPDELSDLVVAPANCATATAAALFRYGELKRGDTVLVIGAGVLGVTACAMARSAGAEVVATCDPVAECRERSLQFGATHSLTDVNQIDELTAGYGADLVLELAGTAATVLQAISSARVGGTVILAGTVAPVGTIDFDPEQAVRRMLTVRGVHNYHPRDLKTAIDFLAGAGSGYPWESLTVAEYPLECVEKAFTEGHRRPGVRVAVVI